MMFRLTVLICLLGLVVSGYSQLPASDQRFVDELSVKLGLTADQSEAVLSLYHSVQHSVDSLDSEIRSIQLNEADELAEQLIPVLQQKKKDAREMREITLKSLLTADQRKKYEDEIRPVAKPTVLHFGIHDRMNCNICTR